jgi:transcriptional regulator with XRE-family HTH domain
MKQRDLSARGFADFVGVSHTLINRLIDGRNPYEPSLDFLLTLSKATQVSFISLVELAFPEIIEASTLSPQARILAEQIEQLPPQAQEAISMMIRGMLNN